MKHTYKLPPIRNPLNSFLFEKEFDNADRVFEELFKLAENLPRTKVIKKENNYWKGVCRSLIFRFPDDLEILKIKSNQGLRSSRGTIQIRSASRFGQSDLGVNERRITTLVSRLDKFNY
tara:strand:- start:1208 stop:1564 length:357 start_codon:yes stop_codon:yes gene_type:complete